METQVHGQTQLRSAFGGVFLSILGTLAWQDVWKTIILGAIGTIVSFFVSAMLGRMFGKQKKHRN